MEAEPCPSSPPSPEVLVLVDFEGQLDDELKITAGDIIQKVQLGPEEGWLQGELDGRVGLFPQQKSQPASERMAPKGTPDPSAAVSLEPTKIQFYQELVGKGQGYGKTPFSWRPKRLESPSEKAASPMQETPKARPPQEKGANAPPRYCRAMFDYEPEHEDELPLRKGDLVLLLNKETVDMGWWEGENRGKKGLFPDNFVMPLTLLDPGCERLPPRPSHRFDAASLFLPFVTRRLVSLQIRTKVPIRSKEAATKGVKKTSQGSKGEMRPVGDFKDSKEQRKMEAPKPSPPPPVKKAAPPPPSVPTKTKPAPSVPQKSSNLPVSCTATPGGKAKSKEAGLLGCLSCKGRSSSPDNAASVALALLAEKNTLDAVVVPGAKLSHPTASRPKMPGKRPPTQLTAGSLVVEKGSICPSSSAEKPKSPEQVKVPSLSKRAESPIPFSESLPTKEPLPSLEDFKAELRTLRTLMDLMHDQHRKDMEELKAAMSQEQTKRAALQAEIERLKQTLPVPGLVDQGCKKPGIVEPAALGVSSMAQSIPSKVSTKD
ncbi:hypothetical protein JD844_005153 [Phrynosoma platyrhinos]|uniref:SH3 domain-containing protein n=1 Tax=Phrynosoma platyrhinos TaxID=52577 RepID=A0ABQ7TNA4_PHRPL|nr:hypothetical protein JD844_005153 [Phrynosoma platyrhinos]